MKFFYSVFLLFLFQSCFESTVKPPDEGIQFTSYWIYEHDIVGDAPPIVLDGRVYGSGGIYLFALDESSGDLFWETQIDEDLSLEGEILLTEDYQIVSNHITSIRGWNINSGDEVWKFDYTEYLKPRRNGNHSVYENTYFFSGLDSWVFALDRSGEVVLEHQLDKKYSVMSVNGGSNKLFIGQRQTVNGELTLGRITTIDSQNGDSLWVYDTENRGFSWAPLVIEDNILYGGTWGNSPKSLVVALNPENGQVIWEYVTEDPLEYTESLLLSPNLVYSGAGGTLVALDKQTGEKVWRFEWTSSTLVRPVYLEGYIYHSDHNRLFILDAETGELVHEEPVPAGGSYFWHLAVSEDKLFAQTSYQLIAYEPLHLRE